MYRPKRKRKRSTPYADTEYAACPSCRKSFSIIDIVAHANICRKRRENKRKKKEELLDKPLKQEKTRKKKEEDYPTILDKEDGWIREMINGEYLYSRCLGDCRVDEHSRVWLGKIAMHERKLKTFFEMKQLPIHQLLSVSKKIGNTPRDQLLDDSSDSETDEESKNVKMNDMNIYENNNEELKSNEDLTDINSQNISKKKENRKDDIWNNWMHYKTDLCKLPSKYICIPKFTEPIFNEENYERKNPNELSTYEKEASSIATKMDSNISHLPLLLESIYSQSKDTSFEQKDLSSFLQLFPHVPSRYGSRNKEYITTRRLLDEIKNELNQAEFKEFISLLTNLMSILQVDGKDAESISKTKIVSTRKDLDTFLREEHTFDQANIDEVRKIYQRLFRLFKDRIELLTRINEVLPIPFPRSLLMQAKIKVIENNNEESFSSKNDIIKKKKKEKEQFMDNNELNDDLDPTYFPVSSPLNGNMNYPIPPPALPMSTEPLLYYPNPINRPILYPPQSSDFVTQSLLQQHSQQQMLPLQQQMLPLQQQLITQPPQPGMTPGYIPGLLVSNGLTPQYNQMLNAQNNSLMPLIRRQLRDMNNNTNNPPNPYQNHIRRSTRNSGKG